MVNDRVYGKDNHQDETMEFLNIMITSFRIIGFLTPSCWCPSPPFFQLDDDVFFLFKQLYDVMSLGLVSPALIEEL